jgi:hypothetical protein
MVQTTESFTVPTTGIGTPDYSTNIEKIKRGETYPMFAPRANTEKYKVFYILMLPTGIGADAPLAGGATRHYRDIETALAAPYTHAAGIKSDFREWFFSVSGRVGLTVFMDGVPIFYMVVQNPCSNHHQYEQIVWGSTEMLDAALLLPHVWDFTLTNLTAPAVDVTGTVHVSLILQTPEGGI